MAHCPNCEAKIPIAAVTCPACSADFGPKSTWLPVGESTEEQAFLHRLQAEHAALANDSASNEAARAAIQRIAVSFTARVAAFGLAAGLVAIAFIEGEPDVVMLAGGGFFFILFLGTFLAERYAVIALGGSLVAMAVMSAASGRIKILRRADYASLDDNPLSFWIQVAVVFGVGISLLVGGIIAKRKA